LQTKLVVDGIRSLSEVHEFKAAFKNFVLIAIHASPKTRFARLRDRGRPDDPRVWTTFLERDARELTVGLGNVIVLADHFLVNHGSIACFIHEITNVLEEVETRWNL
jgi:dephospho-CoA kinase